jgi:hypothetical protein
VRATKIDRVLSVIATNGKIPRMGGDRHIPRLIEIRRALRFLTTNSEIASWPKERASRPCGGARWRRRTSGKPDQRTGLRRIGDFP